MASITINIPDVDLNKVVEALCNGVNPSNAKAKARLIELAKAEVVAYWTQKAILDNSAAVTTAVTNRDSAVTTAKTESEAINIT